MKCSSCGRDSSGKYCQYCGEKLFAGGSQYCSQCGSKVAAGSLSCTQCGCRLSIEAINKNGSAREGMILLSLFAIGIITMLIAGLIGKLLFVFIGFAVFFITWLASIGAAVGEKHTGLVVLLIFIPIIGVPVALLTLDSFQDSAEYIARKEREQRERKKVRKRTEDLWLPIRWIVHVIDYVDSHMDSSTRKQREEEAQARLDEIANPTSIKMKTLRVVYATACPVFFFMLLGIPVAISGLSTPKQGPAHGGFWIFFLPTIISIVVAFCVKHFPVKDRKWRWFSTYTFNLFGLLAGILGIITVGILVSNWQWRSVLFEPVLPSFENLPLFEELEGREVIMRVFMLLACLAILGFLCNILTRIRRR